MWAPIFERLLCLPPPRPKDGGEWGQAQNDCQHRACCRPNFFPLGKELSNYFFEWTLML